MESKKTSKRAGLKISPEINAGHLLTAILISMGLIAGYATFTSRINMMEFRMNKTDSLVEEMSKAVTELKQNSIRSTMIQEQLLRQQKP